MKELTLNKLNHVSHIHGNEIDIIPLNLQDHLILFNDKVLGMYHVAHKTARLFSRCIPLERWLQSEGFKVEVTAESFQLAQWYDDAVVGCGEIIYRNQTRNGNKGCYHQSNRGNPMMDLTNKPNTIAVLQRQLNDSSFVYEVMIVDDEGSTVILDAPAGAVAEMVVKLLAEAFGLEDVTGV